MLEPVDFTVDELMAVCMARTIKDGDTVFNGVAVPLPFTAIMLAKKTHAPNCVFFGGLFSCLDPEPLFLPPTSADSVMLEGAVTPLPLHKIFDLAQRGELDRIFFSGAQIDKYGNLNNTLIGKNKNPKIKLPGGAGASNISCFAKNYTVWSTRHDALTGSSGSKVYSLVEQVDFITTFGHKSGQKTRESLGLRGKGPDWLITNLGVFDFDEQSKVMRLRSLHPGVSVSEVLENTQFEPIISDKAQTTTLPTKKEIKLIREIDPLNTRKKGFTAKSLQKRYKFNSTLNQL